MLCDVAETCWLGEGKKWDMGLCMRDFREVLSGKGEEGWVELVELVEWRWGRGEISFFPKS